LGIDDALQVLRIQALLCGSGELSPESNKGLLGVCDAVLKVVFEPQPLHANATNHSMVSRVTPDNADLMLRLGRIVHRICHAVPLVRSVVMEYAVLQRRSLGAQCESLVRLVVFLAGKLAGQTDDRRLPAYGDLLEDLFAMSGLPAGCIALPGRARLVVVPGDEEDKLVLGPLLMYDEGVTWVRHALMVVDEPLPRRGRLTQVDYRMARAFVKSGAPADEVYTIVVLAPRLGDARIRLCEADTWRTKGGLALFDRVRVPGKTVEEDDTHSYDGVVVGLFGDVVAVQLDSDEVVGDALQSQCVERLAPLDEPVGNTFMVQRADLKPSPAPLNILDHPFTCSRALQVRLPMVRDSKATHAVKLALELEAGERVGIYHADGLGFATSAAWQEFDPNHFTYISGLKDEDVMTSTVLQAQKTLQPYDRSRPAVRYTIEALGD